MQEKETLSKKLVVKPKRSTVIEYAEKHRQCLERKEQGRALEGELQPFQGSFYDYIAGIYKKDPVLAGVNLQIEIDLQGINLQGDDLRQADLQGALLIFTNMENVKLQNGNLKDAMLIDTNMQNVDLENIATNAALVAIDVDRGHKRDRIRTGKKRICQQEGTEIRTRINEHIQRLGQLSAGNAIPFSMPPPPEEPPNTQSGLPVTGEKRGREPSTPSSWQRRVSPRIEGPSHAPSDQLWGRG